MPASRSGGPQNEQSRRECHISARPAASVPRPKIAAATVESRPRSNPSCDGVPRSLGAPRQSFRLGRRERWPTRIEPSPAVL
jgi:hypothetical protein